MYQVRTYIDVPLSLPRLDSFDFNMQQETHALALLLRSILIDDCMHRTQRKMWVGGYKEEERSSCDPSCTPPVYSRETAGWVQ